jgi:hypothetical protein
VDQYLEKIELTMSAMPYKDAIEEQLGIIISSLRAQAIMHGSIVDAIAFDCSVSPLHESLFFDLAVGPRAVSKVDALSSQTCQAEVQPVVELSADDLIEGRINGVVGYAVEIESCNHSFDQQHTGDGLSGESCIRLRLRSYGNAKESGFQNSKSAMCIKEARV